MLAASTQSAEAQIVINGVTDRTTYTDSVQFRVVSAGGFIDEVTLNKAMAGSIRFISWLLVPWRPWLAGAPGEVFPIG